MRCVNRDRQLRNFFAAAGLTLVLFAPMHLKAEDYVIAPREIALLPEYCKYTQTYRDKIPGGNDLQKMQHWYAVMGGRYPVDGMFHHMHHYCRALQHRNYAKFFAQTKQERMFRWERSIVEIDYVTGHVPPDFALLPEILTKRGESLLDLGRASLAVVDFHRAMELKPNYWPPYVVLSDYYKDIGNPKLAREMLQQALSFSPDEKALKRRLAELDGVKATPGTAAKPVTEAVK